MWCGCVALYQGPTSVGTEHAELEKGFQPLQTVGRS